MPGGLAATGDQLAAVCPARIVLVLDGRILLHSMGTFVRPAHAHGGSWQACQVADGLAPRGARAARARPRLLLCGLWSFGRAFRIQQWSDPLNRGGSEA